MVDFDRLSQVEQDRFFNELVVAFLTFGPNALDNTFGPEVVFQSFPPAANFSPFAGLQFFGQVDIGGSQAEMRVSLKDINGATVFTQRLRPHGRAHVTGQ